MRDNDLFLFVGRIVPEKRSRLLAEAARRLGLKAVFIGDGELREEVQRNYPEHTFTGWLDTPAIDQWMRRARAPGVSLALVRDAGAGGRGGLPRRACPSSSRTVSAASRFLEEGRAGLHFQSGSVDSLVEQLGRLRDETTSPARLGQGAYDWYCSTRGRCLPTWMPPQYLRAMLSNPPAGKTV